MAPVDLPWLRQPHFHSCPRSPILAFTLVTSTHSKMWCTSDTGNSVRVCPSPSVSSITISACISPLYSPVWGVLKEPTLHIYIPQPTATRHRSWRSKQPTRTHSWILLDNVDAQIPRCRLKTGHLGTLGILQGKCRAGGMHKREQKLRRCGQRQSGEITPSELYLSLNGFCLWKFLSFS